MTTKKAEPMTQEATWEARRASHAEAQKIGRPVGGDGDPRTHDETIEAMRQAMEGIGGAPLGHGTSRESLRGRPIVT